MLELTTNAKEQFLKKTIETGVDSIRLGVKPGGCNGYEYILDYSEKPNEDDVIFTSHGIEIHIQKTLKEKFSSNNYGFSKMVRGNQFK